MDRWSGRVALVTGASVGIGAAICKKLTSFGINVIGCARNTEKLKEVSDEISAKNLSGTFRYIKCDVKNESEIIALFNEIKTQYGRIDICINNAGLANDASLIYGSTEQWKEMLNVNILGLSICTRESIQLMLEKRINDGQIININSMSGHRVAHATPTHFYSATKFAVTALTEGLRQELREIKSRIRVSSISPGMVETQFAYRLYFNDPYKAASGYSAMQCIKADDIAEVVCSILSMPSHVEINDVLMRPTEQTF